MATSGTTSYSVTELDIITDAMQGVGVIGANDTSIEPEDYDVARRKLNFLIKQWTAQIDFAPGLKMWTKRRAFLFLQANQTKYSIGPSGDECAATSYATSTLASAESAGANTITVQDATDFASTARIGVLLDSGAFQWTTQVGAPTVNTITLGANLTGAASAGARVFGYVSKPLRPFEIEAASVRDTDGLDSPIGVHTIVERYESIGRKSESGDVSELYFEAQRTNAAVFLDCQPSDLTDVIRLSYLSYVEDMSATTNDVDFPAEWFRALSAQLTLDLCIPFQRAQTQDMKKNAAQALMIAKNAYPERLLVEYQNCPDSY